MLKSMHYLWQKLFVKISADRQFVAELAKKFCENDPFMEKILDIYMGQASSSVGVACTRVDYMGD